MNKMTKCHNCEDIHWVCEKHHNFPWAGLTNGVECCGGAGMPCPVCMEDDGYSNRPIIRPKPGDGVNSVAAWHDLWVTYAKRLETKCASLEAKLAWAESMLERAKYIVEPPTRPLPTIRAVWLADLEKGPGPKGEI